MAAHYRKPGYPFVTKVALAVLDNQDVAVSFGSAFCSVLTVLGAYLLGSVAFSPWLGLDGNPRRVSQCGNEQTLARTT